MIDKIAFRTQWGNSLLALAALLFFLFGIMGCGPQGTVIVRDGGGVQTPRPQGDPYPSRGGRPGVQGRGYDRGYEREIELARHRAGRILERGNRQAEKIIQIGNREAQQVLIIGRHRFAKIRGAAWGEPRPIRRRAKRRAERVLAESRAEAQRIKQEAWIQSEQIREEAWQRANAVHQEAQRLYGEGRPSNDWRQ